MPRIKSSIKDVRRTRRRRLVNRMANSNLRTAIKKARVAEPTAEQLSQAFKVIDKAVKTGLLHRNAAARHKSRLAKPKSPVQGKKQ